MVDRGEGNALPEDEGRDARLDAAFAAYLRLCDAVDETDASDDALANSRHRQREEFIAQFPELAPELAQLITTADMLERFVTIDTTKASSTVSPDADTIGAAFTGLPDPNKGSKSGAKSDGNRAVETAENGEAAELVSSREVSVSPSDHLSSGANRDAFPSMPTINPHDVVSLGTGTALVDSDFVLRLSRDDDANNATLPVGDRPPDQPGPRLPFELGDYRLDKMIGRGGMGMVYLATQRGLERQVAVKMIRSGALAGEDEVRRFRAEARAAAKLKHPNIVTVHHFGYLEGHHYFSMDYVPGTDLARKLAEGPLPFEQAARYVRDCARAIHYAHQCGILHRDIKPANVLIDEEDQVRITDFGLAKHTDTESSLTGSGAAVGTPNYMSPEQALGHGDRADRTSDVHALGSVLFALVAGKPPYLGDTVVRTLMQVAHRPAPSPREFRPDTPVDLETIILKCLEKEPKQRYLTAQALADDLDRFLKGRPVLAKSRGRMRRVWHWLNDVPLVAALSGRRFVEASPMHRRVQGVMLLMLILLPMMVAGLVALDRWNRGRMPTYVRIGGGIEGGVYDEIAGELALRISRAQGVDATVVSSNGSVDNRTRLLGRELELAPLQASTIRGDNLCVVAPMFYELVHVLARTDSGIDSIQAMRGRKIAVGPEGSGSRLAATLLFDSFDLGDGDLQLLVGSWNNVEELQSAEGAIVCIGAGSELVTQLLTSGEFQILAIPEAREVSLDHPTLRSLYIRADDYPAGVIPGTGLETVGMPAFLAARLDTPNVLVRAALEAMYSEPLFDSRLIPRRVAAEFQGMQLHPEARKFYDE